MLVKLVLVTCLGVATARPKMRGGRELTLHTGGAVELMKDQPNTSCTAIILMDSTATLPDIVKDLRSIWEQWQTASIFVVNLGNKNTSISDHLSKVISMARQVRQASWCTMVLMVNHKPNILIAFAEWSLRGRLLEWTTKLVVVSRLPLSEVQVLLSSHWTFSMMNTVFFITESGTQHSR
ncbi:uncharacterized protein LOC135114474 [Scylla paramamosain]|uniref:uncharacterized protein LOC135114474 n=1 Tax=Scylla paramamosain TaxID=85552 RepID=UPI0030832C3C